MAVASIRTTGEASPRIFALAGESIVNFEASGIATSDLPGAEERSPRAPSVTLGRIVGFTLGDFACNLFWQSISLYLLYFYTDVIGIPASIAGSIYMIASIWDGACDPIMGAICDRTRSRWGRYRPYILFGAIPLCLSFTLAYYKPPLQGLTLLGFLLCAHILLRTCYTVVSVPYTAMSASITSDSRTRSTVAGFRMIFAMIAGVVVAYFTQPIVAVAGKDSPATGFTTAAAIFAIIALPILLIVFHTTRELSHSALDDARRLSPRDYIKVLRYNQAFWIVMIGIVCTIGCSVAFGKSILYFFKYYLHAEASAHYALAAICVAALAILPAWIFLERRIGKQRAWFVATVWALVGFLYFAATDIDSPIAMTALAVFVQMPLTGLVMTFWSMLPDTVEYGEWRTAIRAEAFVFGLGQFVLKVALGLGAGVFGWSLQRIGYVANVEQTSATLHGMRTIMIVFPVILLSMGGVAMYFYPMRGHAHAEIVAALALRARVK
jgi:GPH family glycoside/pentoside/hexuronide:cation symporter